jgi:hypothetical protein
LILNQVSFTKEIFTHTAVSILSNSLLGSLVFSKAFFSFCNIHSIWLSLVM